MKKKLILAITIIAASCSVAFCQVNYQQATDGFFARNSQGYGEAKEWGVSVVSDSRVAEARAPIGSGLLLLAGMGLTYGVIRRKANGKRLMAKD